MQRRFWRIGFQDNCVARKTEEEALKREAFEELGLKDFKYKLIGKAIFNRRVLKRQENHYFILGLIKLRVGIIHRFSFYGSLLWTKEVVNHLTIDSDRILYLVENVTL